MSFRHLTSDGETEPDALRLGGDKRLEQPRRQSSGWPRPRVGHFNDDCESPIFQSALNLNPSPRPGSLHGIAEHVEKQLLQLTEIARKGQLFRRWLPAQLNASMATLWLQQRDRLANEGPHRAGLCLGALAVAEVEEALEVVLDEGELPQRHGERLR